MRQTLDDTSSYFSTLLLIRHKYVVYKEYWHGVIMIKSATAHVDMDGGWWYTHSATATFSLLFLFL